MMDKDQEEDLVDISEHVSGVRNTANARMRFGKYSIPMTPDEYEVLEKRLKLHREETGTYYGFVRTLL